VIFGAHIREHPELGVGGAFAREGEVRIRSEAAENSGLNVSVSHDSTSIGELNRIGCWNRFAQGDKSPYLAL